MGKKRNDNGTTPNGAMKSSEVNAAYFLSLTLENIRCFGDEPQTLNLSDRKGRPAQWTVLLGNNGAGKTTILQALAFFEDPADELNEFLHKLPGFLRNSTKEGRAEAKVAVGPVLQSVDEQATIVELRYIETPMGYRIDGTPSHSVPLRRYGYGSSRRLSRVSLSRNENDDVAATLFSDDAVLRNAEEWLLQLDYAASKKSATQEQQKKRLAFVKKVLIDIMPKDEVTDIRFTVSSGTHPKASVEFQTPYGWVALRQLGHGFRTLIAWMVDFTSRLIEGDPNNPNPQNAPAVVLVDEIDLHLHPIWQRQLMTYLTGCFPNTQFIVTAHSPLIVQAAAEDANIALLRREGDHVIIDNDVDYIRGWDIDMLLTSDLFGLPSARPPQYDAIFERRKTLLGKSKLTKVEKNELEALNEKVYQLPFGETAQQAKMIATLSETLKVLQKNERKPQ